MTDYIEGILSNVKTYSVNGLILTESRYNTFENITRLDTYESNIIITTILYDYDTYNTLYGITEYTYNSDGTYAFRRIYNTLGNVTRLDTYKNNITMTTITYDYDTYNAL